MKLPGLHEGITEGDDRAFWSCFSCFLYFALLFWNQTWNVYVTLVESIYIYFQQTKKNENSVSQVLHGEEDIPSS